MHMNDTKRKAFTLLQARACRCTVYSSIYLINICDIKEMPLHEARHPVNIYTSHLSYPLTLRSSDLE